MSQEMKDILFTSESVTEGYPDKVAISYPIRTGCLYEHDP